jgi:glutaredoxin
MNGVGKYIVVFMVTCGIFAASWYLSSYFSEKKLAEIRNMQNKISTDILSSETQFSLLEEMSCQEVDSSILSQEIATLADKLTYSEQNVSAREEILMLKKQYSILQVKDFLLSKRIGERCGKKPVSIFYFYADRERCPDCVKQGYVLDALRNKYPDLRTYSFDSELDLSTIRALKSIYKVTDTLPALVLDGKTVSGFKTIEELEALLPTSLTNPPKEEDKKPTTTKVSR